MRKYYQGRSFVSIMIFIAIFVLVLRVTIEQIIRVSIPQNESIASRTLKLYATALDNYAKNNHGAYPMDLTYLTQTNPPYLDKDYTERSSFRGYIYSCSKLDSSGYSCSAAPVICGVTGKTSYIVTTGGFFISEPCKKKE